MKKHILFSFLLTSILCYSQIQKPSVGSIILHENFQSKFVTARNIEVWLPENYNPKKKYAVLYMHDGQMLFDATTTWNKQEWMADEHAQELIKNKQIKPFIIVGIYNGGTTRHADYFPEKPYTYLSDEQKNKVSNDLKSKANFKDVFIPNSDNYLKFLVQEVKPFIDKKYATFTDKNHTFIMGSSMGGLISMYAICEYPNVFGAAACLSTHWIGAVPTENNPIPEAFYRYLKENISKLKNHKIYFDYGNQTLDALYPPYQKEVDNILISNGFTAKNWTTKFFEGENHSEEAWQKRLKIPMLFMMRK